MNRVCKFIHLLFGISVISHSWLVPAAYAQDEPTPTLLVSPDGSRATLVDDDGKHGEYVPDRVIVRFKSGEPILAGSPRSVLIHKQLNIHRVDNPPGLSTEQVLKRYRNNPNVVYAEPDYRVEVVRTPNDPAFVAGQQWGLPKISAQAAWDLHVNSPEVVVAVVDTGIDYSHPDLADNLYTDPATPAVHGYSCLNGNCLPGGADDYGHGTHVAGIIGAATDNGIGIAGLNWQVKLLSIKFLTANGSGAVSDAVLGFNLLRSLKMQGVNLRVTNNSWGGGGYSQALKDAMSALEVTPGYVGTLNVCAAGNSAMNADSSPMYPAAYDNRGIVSVLATDSSDLHASFTNYGLVNVDIAAPGVGIYSTVPTGNCDLCDPAGYRNLNGTSMASPHVAGVAASIISMNPLLTAAQMRDALLRPASYDSLTDPLAKTTTSSGRLNFYKALTNTAFLDNPILNQFPTADVGPNVYVEGGEAVTFSPVTTDPDGDSLRVDRVRGPVSPPGRSSWLLGWQENQIFPTVFPFTAPMVARIGAMPYDLRVADYRGGGAMARAWSVVNANTEHGAAPIGTLTVPASGTVGIPVPITFVGQDPDGKPIAWDLWVSGANSSSGFCCYIGSSTSLNFMSAGAYRISVQAVDPELNLSRSYTAAINIDGAAGIPPVAAAILDRNSGSYPLNVTVDMRSSYDSDGLVSSFLVNCGNGVSLGGASPVMTCNYTEPGTYWQLLQVRDNQNLTGVSSQYVVVYPPEVPTPLDTTPPTVTLLSPTNGSTVSGIVVLQSSAADESGGSGVRQVEYFLDSVAPANSLGVATVSPYAVSWNSATASAGTHLLLAVATDNAGNRSLPSSVQVTVPGLIYPKVGLSPSGSIDVTRKSTLALSASLINTPTYPLARVEFWVNQALICTDVSVPYTCNWLVPAAKNKSYEAMARAYDSRGNMGLSNVLTVWAR